MHISCVLLVILGDIWSFRYKHYGIIRTLWLFIHLNCLYLHVGGSMSIGCLSIICIVVFQLSYAREPSWRDVLNLRRIFLIFILKESRMKNRKEEIEKSCIFFDQESHQNNQLNIFLSCQSWPCFGLLRKNFRFFNLQESEITYRKHE